MPAPTSQLRRMDALERLWPYDGPHTAETVTQAADAASHLVRYLNNATRATPEHASTVYDLVSSLDTVNRRQRQLFRQLSAALVAQAEDSRYLLYDDRQHFPAYRSAEIAANSLREAEYALDNVIDHLGEAAQWASHLGNRQDDGNEDREGNGEVTG